MGYNIIVAHVPVAKLDIASDSDSEDRGFESRRVRCTKTPPEWVAFSVQRTRWDMRAHLRQAMGSAEGRGAKRRHPAGEEAMQPEGAVFS